MKSSSIQTPKNSSKRRSKETPSNRFDFKDSNSSKVVAKCQNSESSDAFEDNSTNSPLDPAISDGNRDESIPENGGKSPNSPLLDSENGGKSSDSPLLDSENGGKSSNSPLLDSSDLTSVEIGDEVPDLGKVVSENKDSGESNAAKTENVEIQIAVDLLVGALDRVKNSQDVDVRSKKIVEDVIKRALEPFDLLSGERNGFCRRLQEKVCVGLICFFFCIVSVWFIMHPGVGSEMQFPDTLRPT